MAPEPRRVVQLAAVHQLVHEDVLAHERRRLHQPPVERDRAAARARPPPRLLVAHADPGDGDAVALRPAPATRRAGRGGARRRSQRSTSGRRSSPGIGAPTVAARSARRRVGLVDGQTRRGSPSTSTASPARQRDRATSARPDALLARDPRRLRLDERARLALAAPPRQRHAQRAVVAGRAGCNGACRGAGRNVTVSPAPGAAERAVARDSGRASWRIGVSGRRFRSSRPRSIWALTPGLRATRLPFEM